MRSNRLKRALFLDRDGVINVDHGYVYRRQDFDWRDGVFDLVREANAAGYLAIVVSNQSGIARGKFTEADFNELTVWMREEFALRDAPIAAVYHCPFMQDAALAEYRDDKFGWRKPKPGMLLQARDDFGLDLSLSTLIGDQWSDAQAAWAAGVGRTIIIGDPRRAQPSGAGEALRFPDVRAAADWLIAELHRG
jgi:D-glycero-D-manno-heptose 1,7-bisphosphate phosphatase